MQRSSPWSRPYTVPHFVSHHGLGALPCYFLVECFFIFLFDRREHPAYPASICPAFGVWTRKIEQTGGRLQNARIYCMPACIVYRGCVSYIRGQGIWKIIPVWRPCRGIHDANRGLTSDAAAGWDTSRQTNAGPSFRGFLNVLVLGERNLLMPHAVLFFFFFSPHAQ